MRLKAPRVPTAASAAFSAATGPRVLPGTYTVKMTKDKNVYTTQLQVTAAPRQTHVAKQIVKLHERSNCALRPQASLSNADRQ